MSSLSHTPEQEAPTTPRKERKVSVMTLLQHSPLSASSQKRRMNKYVWVDSGNEHTDGDIKKHQHQRAEDFVHYRPKYESSDRETSPHPIKTVIIRGSSTDISNHTKDTGETADETSRSSTREPQDDDVAMLSDPRQQPVVIGRWITSPSSSSPSSSRSQESVERTATNARSGCGEDGGVVIPTELLSPLGNGRNRVTKQEDQSSLRDLDTTMSSQQSPLSLPTVDLYGTSDHSTYSFAGDYGMNRDSSLNGDCLEYSTGSMSFNSNFRSDVYASMDAGGGQNKYQQGRQGRPGKLSSQKMERTDSFICRRNKRLELLKSRMNNPRKSSSTNRDVGRLKFQQTDQNDHEQNGGTSTKAVSDEEGQDEQRERLRRVVEEESLYEIDEVDHSSSHGGDNGVSPPTPNQVKLQLASTPSPIHTTPLTPNRAALRKLIVDSYATLSPLSTSNTGHEAEGTDGPVSLGSRSLSHADYQRQLGHESPQSAGSCSPTKMSPTNFIGRSASLPPSPSRTKDNCFASRTTNLLIAATRKNALMSGSNHSHSNSTSGSSRQAIQLMRLEEELDGANGIISQQQARIQQLEEVGRQYEKEKEEMQLRFEQARIDHDIQLRMFQHQLDEARARIQQLEEAERQDKFLSVQAMKVDSLGRRSEVVPLRKHRPGQVDTDEIYTQSPLFHDRRRHSIGSEAVSKAISSHIFVPFDADNNSTSNRSQTRSHSHNSTKRLPILPFRQNQSQGSFLQASINRNEGFPC